MRKESRRVTGLVAVTMVVALLVGLLPMVASADYNELSVGTVWPSSSRTFPREVTVINCDRLIIHQYADFSSREVLSATRGRRFTATGMSGEFIEVQLDDGSFGYGYASYLQPGAELSGATSYNRTYNTPFGGYVVWPYYGWHVIRERPEPRPHPKPIPDPVPNPVPNPNPYPIKPVKPVWPLPPTP